MKDILSSLKDCLRWNRGEQSGGSGEPEPASTLPSHHGDRAQRWDTSYEQGLAKAREAHQQALVAAAVLEQWTEGSAGQLPEQGWTSATAPKAKTG